jgi:hypothetical protein
MSAAAAQEKLPLLPQQVPPPPSPVTPPCHSDPFPLSPSINHVSQVEEFRSSGSVLCRAFLPPADAHALLQARSLIPPTLPYPPRPESSLSRVRPQHRHPAVAAPHRRRRQRPAHVHAALRARRLRPRALPLRERVPQAARTRCRRRWLHREGSVSSTPPTYIFRFTFGLLRDANGPPSLPAVCCSSWARMRCCSRTKSTTRTRMVAWDTRRTATGPALLRWVRAKLTRDV